MIAALAAITSALALALLVVALVLVRARRSAAERLGRVVHRFAGQDDDDQLLPGEADFDAYGMDDWLSHMESVATTAAMTANLAERDRARWQLAMDELAIGVVLVDEEGSVCASNALADEMMSARDAMALVGAGVRELLESARMGHARSRTVKLTGPPPRVLEISAHPVESDGHALGAVAVIADRTEGARTDEVRRDFVANLSHELRTPVGAIALLSETLAQEDDAAVRGRLVDRIGLEADRVRHIIDDLLELSRIELEGSMRQEAVPVAPLLSEVAQQYSEHARMHEVELVQAAESAGAAVPADSVIVLHADRGQLLRAVGNLVDNAIKYSDPGSEVRLSVAPSRGDDRAPSDALAGADAPVAHIGSPEVFDAAASEIGSVDASVGPPSGPASAQANGAWVDIVVADEGIGIPADETERVFERFYRVDKARARATGGTGLGLSIVRHVVANHGGEVMLHSREGVGTTFTLRFPASADPDLFDRTPFDKAGT
ncbi:sensor histidine kinase [Candidatus Poriferisodalis sp.]|uniref:sensor histidine kinase n=1 Tax=Candidatus Poriferisodalis sp. TaxID=3101277 RepID=UPI003B0256C4